MAESCMKSNLTDDFNEAFKTNETICLFNLSENLSTIQLEEFDFLNCPNNIRIIGCQGLVNHVNKVSLFKNTFKNIKAETRLLIHYHGVQVA